MIIYVMYSTVQNRLFDTFAFAFLLVLLCTIKEASKNIAAPSERIEWKEALLVHSVHWLSYELYFSLCLYCTSIVTPK